jgi:diaminopimelate epimerase
MHPSTEPGLPFAKYSGAGNDFLIVEASRLGDRDPAALSRLLCARSTGVGVDGLVLARVEAPGRVDIRFFNPDGSEFGTCGNGTRCVAAWAYDRGHAPGGRVTIVTGDGSIEARVTDGLVALDFLIEAHIERRIEVPYGGGTRPAWLVRIGTPHLVVPLEALPEGPIDELARPLRHLAELGPAGANVDFVELEGPALGVIRTFERGVEAETLACGSGAMASAVVLEEMGRTGPTLVLRTRSGDDLEVTLSPAGEGPTRAIRLAGPARVIFEGWLGGTGARGAAGEAADQGSGTHGEEPPAP